MDIKQCVAKGLLRRDVPDNEKAAKSIERAWHKIEVAKKVLKIVPEEAVANAYASMFHAARSLLFRDGYVEKSHFALFVYVKEQYADRLELRFLNELNTLRLDRHAINYGLDPIRIDYGEAKNVIETAEDFIKAVEGVLKK
ncbi:MAG: HEPN domain-containing protein [Nanoarchaeota archaeon]